MAGKFIEYKQFSLSQVNKDILKLWEDRKIFEKSLSSREGSPDFIFFEGPPSANGLPGIHHVMARTIKDIFCRFKTMKGFKVDRKAGWDTHGLPVELAVEKKLGIRKDDIGKKISLAEYNKTCRSEVMKYTDIWEDITHKMGYWIDMHNPYITYDNRYIETLWWILKELYNKGLLYKGYTIQPYSPAAGTGLSTHELNQPGCYKNVKDTTIVAQFEVKKTEKSEFLFNRVDTDLFFLAWTTTPWTLPSNVALAVGKDISYVKVKTFNPYTGIPVTLILAKDLVNTYFPEKNKDLKLEDYKAGDKNLPYRILSEYKGSELEHIEYKQLIPWHQPEGKAFFVTCADFVTTVDGTGIVHIAPSFGADDFRVAKAYGINSLTLVDRQGKFIENCGEFSGRFVKNEYDDTLAPNAPSVDVDIAVLLKQQNKAFKIEKHEHSYPHCWRTDKPILYYPLDSWFIKTTAVKERMIELNKTINWKPESTGTGRFGQWLENLVDWNLSRSRFWGTPLPVWATAEHDERICIGSVSELKNECEKAVKAGLMQKNPLENFNIGDNSPENYDKFDLHRPFVDDIILVSPSGKPMKRETDLIDVWFDSGAMPYAQWHYPFENKENFDKLYPANFIAEGVDQTRGWFFTLHAIAVMLFDKVSFKNLISNGLVLDKDGNKMSKRLGNVVDPFVTIEENGSDPLRWYMISNSQPWDNLKFDLEGVKETTRKFFGTLYNTYSFFALYANVDEFQYTENEIPVQERPEIDRWIISLLNTLIKEVEQSYEEYEPTRAARLIEEFVSDNLSNWYVRLNRKRFWGGGKTSDKLAAYQTLYKCLETVAQLIAPISPFFSDKLFLDLNNATAKNKVESVHLSFFPEFNNKLIDKPLEERMKIAQKISSMVLALRKKVNLKVRQPLSKIMIPILDESLQPKVEAVANIIQTEINVKSIEFLTDSGSVLVKKIKPNFKTLGPKYGKFMKKISEILSNFSQSQISDLEKSGAYTLEVENQKIELGIIDVEIISEDIPGWLVSNEGALTVALDINVTQELKEEGIARELINRIQNLRKVSGLDVTDKIKLEIKQHNFINKAVENFKQYIGNQTLATAIQLVDHIDSDGINTIEIELDDDVVTLIKISNN